MSLARYGFLPWLRQGISAKINEEDTLGGPAGKAGRPTVDISLSVSGIKLGASAATPITEADEDPAVPNKAVFKKVELIGPGDITGIKQSAIVKTEPLAGVSTFEPNYLPYIEFYEEDFPWRYTPAAAKGEKLRPWLVLVVLEETEFERRFFPGAPLTAITHGQRPIAFPPAAETWAWAHVQVNHPLEGTDKAAALRAVVDTNPNLASSRLLCPRRLKANTSYAAFLLPAFEQGRLAGLGAAAERIQNIDIQASSWGSHPNDEYAHLWPVYSEWDFRTGDLADFEYLVRRIEARTLEDPVGRRPVDMQDAGYELSYRGGDGSLLLEGALQLVGAAGQRADFLGGGTEEKAFISHLQTLLNLNTDLEAGQAGPDPINQTLYVEGGVKDDPIITPPLYGQWHADTFRADASKSSEWFHELNLDPRNRVAAGFGTMVVRKNQDAYMDRAWKQVEAVLEARRRIKLGRFAAEAGQKLQAAYFDKMDESSFSAFSSSFHSRSHFVEGGETQEATVQEVLYTRLIQPANLAALFRNQHADLRDAHERRTQAQVDLSRILDDIQTKETEIQSTENQIASRQEEIDQLEAQIATLEAQIDEKNTQIQALENESIGPLLQTLQELEAQLATEEDPGEVARLRAEIEQTNNVLALLQQQLSTLKFERNGLQNQKQQQATALQNAEELLAAAQALLLQQQSELAGLQQEKTAKEDEIRSLENQISFITSLINRLARLHLPSSSLRQDYRKLARPNGPALRRALGGAISQDPLAQLSAQINLAEAPDQVEDLPASLNTKSWDELEWGAASFATPPLEQEAAPEAATTSTGLIRSSIKKHIQPASALNKRLNTIFDVQTASPQEENETPNPLITYPEFKEAMYAALSEISAELMLPNVQLIPMDTFALLEVNRRFIESYLVGLNHEMARELLWREYPTDQRGSYFRRFWDDLDNLAATAPPPDIELLTAMNKPLGQNAPVGAAAPPASLDDPQVVFVIRSELLKKFPNALVFMQRAKWADDKAAPRLLTIGKDDTQRKMPQFKASINPEVSFYGFPITAKEALGDQDNPGWFFIVQERPGEPRFGMDISPEDASDTFENIAEWNDLAWPMAETDANGFLSLASRPALGKPPKAGTTEQYTWARNSAHLAAILFQLPFMVAIHATDMIKIPD
jgi:predicted  nucleic acid-binding Zn-ribbon protein